MSGWGWLLIAFGALGIIAGFAIDASVANEFGRVVNLSFTNIKEMGGMAMFAPLLVITGNGLFISGVVLVGIDTVATKQIGAQHKEWTMGESTYTPRLKPPRFPQM